MSSRVSHLCVTVGLALALLCPTEKADADSFLQFKAGASNSRTELLGSPGLSLGGSLALTRWAPSAHFALIPQLELLFARRNASISEGDEAYALDFIELPFVLRGELTIGNRSFHALAGGYGSMLFRAQQAVDGIVRRVDAASPVDVGLLVGGGVELGSFSWGELFLEARYQRGYRVLLANDSKHEAFSLLLGYGMASDATGSGLSHAPNQRLALKGGLIATRFRSSESQAPTYTPGYSFGGAFSPARFGSRLALMPQLELSFVHRSAYDGLPEDGSLALDYVDVSMLMRGEMGVVGGSVYGIGGVYGSVLLRAQRDHDGAITNMRNMVSPVDAGWIAGGGIELASTARAKLSFELRYQRGFHDIYRAHTSKVTQQSISCLFGVTYGPRSEPSSTSGTLEAEPIVLYSGNDQDNTKRAKPTRSVTSVGIGYGNYRWVSLMPFAKIERGKRDGKYGYQVTYRVPGHQKSVVFFWPRDHIDFDGKARGYREVRKPWGNDELVYPTRLTRKSLPKVFPYILQIEQAYAAQANGAISAMQGFTVVAGLGGAKPSLRATSPRAPPRSTTSTHSRANARQASRGATATPASSATAAVAPSSRALGKALEAAGHVRPPGSSAHHIVAGKARMAEPARGVLERFGIGLNDAVNGVFLPATRASPNPTGAAVHSTLHTRRYYETINRRLTAATTRAEVEAALRFIGQKLLTGGL